MKFHSHFILALIFSSVIISVLLPNYVMADVYTNKLGMRFVRIPKGEFIMGSPKSEQGRQWNEKQHRVIISKDFYMGETEVTQGQWEKLVGFNPSSYPKMGKDFPVDTISWDECIEFIRVLNQWENTNKYRLPTEAEWEYACRAGSATAFASGPITAPFSCNIPEPSILEMAWYCYNSGLANPSRDFRPHPVKTKLPNAFGLYDMHGNVQEWVQDSCKRRNFWRTKIGVVTDTYKDNIVDPLNTNGEHKIIRGGGWYQTSKYQRSAYRSLYKPVVKRNSLGFRIVRMP
ncbi:MAG: formylglycine-generating enzyme family protein [Proteobacteria bacterium]|nr:formylglycine-generating enzyme family protein [Pseudomonadota bacterium]MBU1389127.1 formylglycine-generating enzyme family protein [Pseudomonadota bacterium]MBU1543351.1 formylglycine-generating enzyme family protein [Pseudomonadota bacterium]MBU2480904.1 formylglycine-generating enzyme family protein [Pseudomonadota bacterium]